MHYALCTMHFALPSDCRVCDAAILKASVFGVVVAFRLRFAVAVGGQRFGFNAETGERVADGFGAVFRKSFIVFVRALIVGVSADFDDDRRRQFLNIFGGAFQKRQTRGRNVEFIAFKINEK